MKTPLSPCRSRRAGQRGTTLIEVLVTLIILMVGLLGLVGLMVQSQRGQVESYQRVQALVIMQDMVNRINTNRKSAACYVTATYVGTGGTLPSACAIGTAEQKATADRDLSEWSSLLLGAAETSGGNNAGAMIGARGCVTSVATDVYRVTVAWQGQSATKAPPASADAAVDIPCAKDLYNSDGTDNLRRAVYQDIQIVDLLG
jgi:type IV pilus assembly protein PilV